METQGGRVPRSHARALCSHVCAAVLAAFALRPQLLAADPFVDPFVPNAAAQEAAVASRDATPPSPAERPPDGLTWVNGDSLPGRVIECTESNLIFQSPAFTEAVKLRLDALAQFDQIVTGRAPRDPFAVRLCNGSVIMARILEITDKIVRIESTRCGTLALDRSQVASLERARQAPEERRPVEKTVAPENPAGAPEPAGGYFVRGNFPETVDLVFSITLDPAPAFRMEIAGDGARRLTLETMASDLVLQGREFSSLHHFRGSGGHRAKVHLFWDQSTGRTALYSEGPGILAETDKAPTSVTRITAKGLLIHNKNEDKKPSIEFLGMNSWDGELPRTQDGTASGVRLARGREILGQVIAADATTVRVMPDDGREETAVPWAEITKLRLSAQPVKASAEGSTELWFADEAVVKGTLLSLKNGTARLMTSFTPQPVSVALDSLRRMILPGMTRGIVQDGSPFEQLDSIELGSARMRGSLAPAEGGELRWVLPGADSPVRLAKTPDFRFVSSSDTLVAPAPLFFLRSGEVFAGALASMNENEIEIAGEHSRPFHVPCAQVRAMQFGGTQSKLSGFGDEEWTVLLGGDQAVVRTTSGVILRDGVVFAHPSILRGNQLQFAMQTTRYLSILRARLFCEGAGRNPGAATTLVFRCFGNEIRYGLDAGRAFEDEWGKTAHATGEIVPVKMRWEGGWLYVSAGQGPVLQLPARTRSGIGLRFEIESAGRFRAGDNSISLSRFQVGAVAGQTWMPSVSAEAKDQALTLPRFRKEDPPVHALIATNRDVLRGQIEAARAGHIQFRSGLQSFRVPMDRVAAAIWLQPPESAKPVSAPASSPPPAPDALNGVWLMLKNGAQYGLALRQITSTALHGTHPVMGECIVPLDHIQRIVCDQPDTPPALVEFDTWRLRPAQEPLISKSGASVSPLVGQEVPAIALPLLDAGELDLAKQRGRVVVLDFWASWCGPCIRSLPDLARELARFPADKVAFIAVNQGESAEAARQFLLARKLQLRVALDPRQKAGALLGASAIPHTIVIDAEGKIAWIKTGASSGTAQETAEVVAKLLAK